MKCLGLQSIKSNISRFKVYNVQFGIRLHHVTSERHPIIGLCLKGGLDAPTD
jgi:hypothetical protein